METFPAKRAIESDSGYKKIKFNPFKRGFIIEKTKKLSGITKRLSKCFWPEYKLQSARKTESQRLDQEYTIGRTMDVRSPTEGRRRGTEFHEELKEYTLKRHSSDAEYERYTNDCKKNPLLDITYMALKYLGWSDLVPIFAELCVGSKEDELATAIDLVCTNKKNEVCLVEVKSGFSDVFEDGRLPMNWLVNRKGHQILDSPLNQASVQLAVSSVLFERTFSIPVDKHYVLNVSAAGASLYPRVYETLPEDKDVEDFMERRKREVPYTENEIIQGRREIYNIFLNRLAEEKEKKKKKKQNVGRRKPSVRDKGKKAKNEQNHD